MSMTLNRTHPTLLHELAQRGVVIPEGYTIDTYIDPYTNDIQIMVGMGRQYYHFTKSWLDDELPEDLLNFLDPWRQYKQED